MTVFGQKPSAALAVMEEQKDAARQIAETEAAMRLRCFFICGTPFIKFFRIQRLLYLHFIVTDIIFLHNSKIVKFWLNIAIVELSKNIEIS